MKRYKSPKFDTSTTKEDKTKLLTALRAVQGVESVTLHPRTNEFEIKARDNQEPERGAIAAAASRAGFTLAGG